MRELISLRVQKGRGRRGRGRNFGRMLSQLADWSCARMKLILISYSMSCISHSGLGPSRIKCLGPPTDPNGPVLIGWDPKTKTLPSQPGTRCISILSLTQLLSDTKHDAAPKPLSKPLSFDDFWRLKSLKALGAIERFTLYRRTKETDCKHLKSYFHAVSSCFRSSFGDFVTFVSVFFWFVWRIPRRILLACCRKGPSKAENSIFNLQHFSLGHISSQPPIHPESCMCAQAYSFRSV